MHATRGTLAVLLRLPSVPEFIRRDAAVMPRRVMAGKAALACGVAEDWASCACHGALSDIHLHAFNDIHLQRSRQDSARRRARWAVATAVAEFIRRETAIMLRRLMAGNAALACGVCRVASQRTGLQARVTAL